MADIGMTEADDELSNNEPIMEALPQTDGEAEPMEGVAAITELVSPPKDQEPDPSLGEYTWEVPNFSQLPGDKVFSPTFQIGGFPWRLLVFPRGNKLHYVSMYLDCSEELQPPGWSRRAAFKLTLLNQLDPSKSVSKDAQHVFRETANDWGFTQFLPLAELHDRARGFLVNDTMKLRVEVNVDRTDSIHYDSKKETGYVGLKNQGATCYMNSLLQTLYNINFFRQAVYHMPTTEDDEPAKSMPLALQSLFYKLQFGDSSVSTKDLTKSFGWDNQEAFMQHDVQELNRVLCEKLEDKMKATKVEGTINKLFEGYTCNFIECINVDFKSTRRESFMDLQLDVKGSRDIYHSFDKYCEVEQLDGQNQYKAEGHGLQDARKGVLFDVFPPVLQLQLKRFEYDFQRDMMVKINDRYEFFDELDLDREDGKYLSPSADRSVRNVYRLHSVLVHSGGVHGGHYYAYIRPDGKQWLKFDDEKVTKEDRRKALDEQFGGEDENPAPGPGFNTPPTFKFTKYSNAYMLVYVRESDWNAVMCSVTEKDISDHVRLRLKAEADEKERRRKEKLEAHLFTVIKLARDEDMAEQIGTTRFFDLVDHDKPQVKQFRVRKQLLFSEFKAEVEKQLGVPVDRQRYWLWAKRQNNTYRPNRPMQLEDDTKQVMDIKDGTYRNGVTDLRLYLEVPASPTAQLLPISKHEILLFFKFYDPATETLRYAHRAFAHKTTKISDLFLMMRQKVGLPEDAALEAYEEIKFEPSVMCDRVPNKQTLMAAQLEDGDIICFQQEVSKDDEARFRHPRVKDYLEYVRNRQVVLFKKLDTPSDEGLRLELSKLHSYDEVCTTLAAALKLDDPQLLRLTQHNCFAHTPKPAPLKWRGVDSLVDMLVHYNHVTDILYYEVLDIPLPELERLKTLKVVFHNDKAEEVGTHTVRLPKESCVADVLSALAQQLGAAVPAGRPLRLLEVFYSKIYKVFDPAEKIDTINDQYWTVRAEVVPEDEQELGPGQRIIMVTHMHTDASRHANNFGDPFLLRIDDDETLADVKPRIQAKLGIADEEFAKWKFAHVCTMRPAEYLADADVVAQRWPASGGQLPSGNDTPYLGLEHTDAHPRRNYHQHSRLSQYERPVKIYN